MYELKPVNQILLNKIDIKMSNILSVAKYRNAKTQHGDYRSVDEENIVVLRFCHSPVPDEGESTSVVEDGTSVEKEVVWFDFDFPEKVCVLIF